MDTAHEAGDDQLTALAHGYAAHLATTEALTTAALDHLTTATEHARSTPTLASWLATIEATLHADRGEHAAARQALDRAHAALSQLPGRPISPLSHDSTTANLAAATGTCSCTPATTPAPVTRSPPHPSCGTLTPPVCH